MRMRLIHAAWYMGKQSKVREAPRMRLIHARICGAKNLRFEFGITPGLPAFCRVKALVTTSTTRRNRRQTQNQNDSEELSKKKMLDETGVLA